jgi:hypothetical protein
LMSLDFNKLLSPIKPVNKYIESEDIILE